ncbi:DNA adenine methylase [Myxococcus sp. AM010]|uniref:DNA adenine methylase n=1 Tax=Myxococcus sp. AM010 TaxID=2745138 RepID=UPI00159559BF|nr:DNA adenine methylase [Myxococcus sp. AM010]NVJ13156.1 DNA adenine methylase [Myxococcus sp. AM010]
MKAPFPWFGGKSRAAHLVWEAFGNVPNYVEPFAGSLAVLLARPTAPGVETVNDLDTYLANFWRALSAAPDEVAHHADWPVNEADLHARHRWLVAQADFRARMRQDPEYFDARIAGWWVWGICQWIGSGWCAQPSWASQDAAGGAKTCGIATAEYAKRPMLDKPGRGVHQLGVREGNSLANAVNWEGRSNAGRRARGVHSQRARELSASAAWEKRPSMGRGGRGVHGNSLWSQKPDLSGSRGAAGRGVHASGRQGGILGWMQALAERLRYVRVCCGDWQRVTSRSVTECIGVTGVFLDPPYSDAAGRDPSLYAEENLQVAHHVREWAVANGDNPRLRIALCGYEGEHALPASWRCVAWKAPGGYAAARGNHANALRERIWLSPHCLAPVEDPFHGLPLARFSGGAR